MNMNNPLENLRQLTEAVRMAGADIAPTYIEYVQLAFAIANDCGEAGRNDFLSLCCLSSKYDEKNAQALFSNALHADKEDIHLGTVFHLAGQCGVKISGSTGSHKAGTMGTAGTAPDFPHTCARYNKVGNNISDDDAQEETANAAEDTDHDCFNQKLEAYHPWCSSKRFAYSYFPGSFCNGYKHYVHNAYATNKK